MKNKIVQNAKRDMEKTDRIICLFLFITEKIDLFWDSLIFLERQMCMCAVQRHACSKCLSITEKSVEKKCDLSYTKVRLRDRLRDQVRN